MDKVIEVKNLSKSFGKLNILNNINMTLHKGENIGIIGKSGIGKSVLAKCIVRLIEPDSGEVYILGKDILNMDDNELNEIRKKVGYLFQGGALYDSMSVRQNLEFPIRRTQVSGRKNEVNQMVEEALENVGLLDAIDKMPAELSGGMKKRIGLARAIILKPEIILYDEPTTGMDAVTAAEISELIVKIQNKYQTSSIIITHDMNCAKAATNKIMLLKDGNFYAEGSHAELSQSTDSEIRNYFV